MTRHMMLVMLLPPTHIPMPRMHIALSMVSLLLLQPRHMRTKDMQMEKPHMML